jgi:hypothetical protein
VFGNALENKKRMHIYIYYINIIIMPKNIMYRWAREILWADWIYGGKQAPVSETEERARYRHCKNANAAVAEYEMSSL